MCIHGTITATIDHDVGAREGCEAKNVIRRLDIRTVVSPVLLFNSINQESSATRHEGIQNSSAILRAILLTMEQETPKSTRRLPLIP